MNETATQVGPLPLWRKRLGDVGFYASVLGLAYPFALAGCLFSISRFWPNLAFLERVRADLLLTVAFVWITSLPALVCSAFARGNKRAIGVACGAVSFILNLLMLSFSE